MSSYISEEITIIVVLWIQEAVEEAEALGEMKEVRTYAVGVEVHHTWMTQLNQRRGPLPLVI